MKASPLWRLSVKKWAGVVAALKRGDISQVEAYMLLPCGYCEEYNGCQKCGLNDGVTCYDSVEIDGLHYWIVVTNYKDNSKREMVIESAEAILAKILKTKFQEVEDE